MRERLFILFWEDRAVRIKMYASALIFSLLFGLLLSATGTPEREIANDVILVCILWLSLWTALYCAFTLKHPTFDLPNEVTRRLAIAGTITSIASIMCVSIEALESAIINRRLKMLSALSTIDTGTTEKIDNILTYAVHSHVPIDPIHGKALIDLAKIEPTAWDAALKFVAYRTSLNMADTSNAVPFLNQAVLGFATYDLNPRVPGGAFPKMRDVPTPVPMEQSARYEIIGENPNEGNPVGPLRLILSGGALNIDNRLARHVVFENIEIHYTNKPLILEDVVFINCTFVIDNGDRARKLSEQLISSSVVNFKSNV